MEMNLEKKGLGTLFTKVEPILKTLEKDHFYLNLEIKPRVSVVVVTYNHEDYIEECLNSIYSQKTNFNFEVIICDDASTDSNQKKIEEIAKKHKIRTQLLLQKENLSKKFIGYTTAKLNFLNGLYHSEGEYIVNIEGDDYLIDENKLQKQFDFLEENKEFSACFHNTLMKFEDSSDQKDYEINPENQQEKIRVEDLLVEKETWFMGTASVMFRRSILAKLKPWFGQSKSGDIPLYVLLAETGPIGYIAGTMSVYRRHENGMSYTDNRKDINFVENRIYMYRNLKNQIGKNYKKLINPILADYYELMAETEKNEFSTFRRIKNITKSIFYHIPKDGDILKNRLSKIIQPLYKQRFKNLLHKLKLTN